MNIRIFIWLIGFTMSLLTSAYAQTYEATRRIKEAQILFDRGTKNYDAGHYDSAKEEILRSLVAYKSGHYREQYIPYQYLADIAYRQGNMHLSVYYLQQGQKYMTAGTPPSTLENYDYHLARDYTIMGQPDSSLTWARKGAEWAETLKNREGYYLSVDLMALALLQESKATEALATLQNAIKHFPPDPQSAPEQLIVIEDMGACYLMLNEQNKAKRYYARLDRLYQSYNRQVQSSSGDYYINLVRHYYAMGQFHLQTGQYEKALADLQTLDTALSRFPRYPPEEVSQINFLHFKADSAARHYFLAIRHLEQYNRIKDSIYNDIKTRQISDLNIQYATDQKLKDISLLKTQKDIQESALQKLNLQRNLILGGSIMLLVITMLAYHGYRLKKRSNAQLQLKQTEINQQNIILEELVADKDKLLEEKDELLEVKEILMKEIHHRVKNNLYMISSLLESQTAYLQDEALVAVQTSQHRVQAISLIHHKLYLSSTLTTVNMSIYLREMINYLQDNFVSEEDIRFHIDIDPIDLDVAQAVPLGLIVNEAITNSIKYAFPRTQKGTISISLHQNPEYSYELCIADDGIGLPQPFDIHKNNSLGMSLIKGFSKSLRGRLQISSETGTRIHLIFANDRTIQNNS